MCMLIFKMKELSTMQFIQFMVYNLNQRRKWGCMIPIFKIFGISFLGVKSK